MKEWLLLSASVCILSIALFGGYDRPVRLINVAKGFIALTFSLIALEFFQGAELAGFRDTVELALLALVITLLTRIALHALHVRGYSLRSLDRKRVLAIGSEGENKHALALLWQTHFGLGRQKQMSTSDAGSPDAMKLIRNKIRKHGIDEVVFCARDLSWGRIIELIEGLKRSGAMFKISQPEREFVIGPNSVESLHDLDIMELHAVNSSAGRRTKRLMDLTTAALFLITWPLTTWFIPQGAGFARNAWSVLLGDKSWVGYHKAPDRTLKLPSIKPGVIDPLIDGEPATRIVATRANIAYAKDYSAWQDLGLILRGFRSLGRA